MEIRPHRRLVVAYEPPRFTDLVSVSESVSDLSDHVGVAKFNHSMFAFTDVSVLRRMCDSIALKLMIECSGNPSAALGALEGGANLVVVRSSDLPHLPDKSKVLVRVDAPEDAVFASSCAGVACGGSFVQGVRVAYPDAVIFATSGDAVTAVKNGANYVVVGDSVLDAEDPGEAARDLAEAFRPYT